MNPIIQLKQTTSVFFVALLLASIAIPLSAQAVSPPPDGGYAAGNTAEGDFALQNLTTGTFNTALGEFALFSNTDGFENTATGAGALFSNTTGFNNTANGAGALENNIDGKANTAIGFAALFNNTTISGISGDDNTAVGKTALASNTIGSGNTAIGSQALLSNTADANTAVGAFALQPNTIGDDNTAIGDSALGDNTTGDTNTAVGFHALFHNTNGNENTAVGVGALRNNTTGGSNIAIGLAAGLSITTTSNNIDIGNQGVAGDSDTIRVGDSQTTTFIAGIAGVNEGVPNATVFINLTTGQLGTTPGPSSRQYKKEIKPMDKVSEAILALKPVTFQYKSDQKATPQFGLIAEEVAQVNPDLIVRDEKGEIYSVRYEAVNAMLLNEFLKEHRKVQRQDGTIADLKSTVAKQQQQIKALASGLQRVSAQLEVNKPARQTVANNQ